MLSGLDCGYRLIDTAVNYQNEAEVGEAVRRSGVERSEILLTTKLPGRHHGYDETIRSFEESRRALDVDTVDLYLIHWPNPSVDRYLESWRAMIQLQRDGLVTSIGVSNFTPEYLTRLGDETGVLPAVNQIEMHPYFPQEELRAFHAELGIQTQAWSPLGKGSAVGTENVILSAAEAHSVSFAQVILRWHVQLGSIPLPKSASAQRQRANLDITSFELSDVEMARITRLGRQDGRLFDGDPRYHEEQ